jgi:hypothetical protein
MNRSQRVVTLPPRVKVRKYPIWSVKTITILSLLLTAIVAAVVFGFGKRSILVEAEWVAVIVATSLFVFLFVGLYRGIRVKKAETPPTDFEFINVDAADIGDLGWADGIDGDWPVLILAPILFIVFGILLVFLLPVLVNLVWLLLFVFVVMLFWIFRYALRQVFVRSRQTRGQLAPSLYYASVYTALYSGWLLVVLITARHFVGA